MRQGYAIRRASWDLPEEYADHPENLQHVFLTLDKNGVETVEICYSIGGRRPHILLELDRDNLHATDWEIYNPTIRLVGRDPHGYVKSQQAAWTKANKCRRCKCRFV